MKKTVLISGYNNELKGEFTIDKKQYVVGNVIAKEKVVVDIDKNNVKLINILEKSPKRILPICQKYVSCGGCTLQHLDYQEQLKVKTKWLESLFQTNLNIKEPVLKVLGMEQPFYYRNKNQMVLRKGPKGLIGGMYEEGTHNVIDIDNCPIQDKIITEVQITIKKLLSKYRYQAYDEDKQSGVFRHILVKRSSATKEILVVLITGMENFPGKNNFIKELIKQRPDITTIIQNTNNRKTSAILGGKELVLYGPGFIFDKLLGMKFRITSKSFYQVNSKQTEVLYSKALSAANLEKTDVLLDAYSGVGTIGILAAANVKEVISVEIGKDAVECAKLNAKYNNIRNIKFSCADATDFILKLVAEKQSIDVVIMDPPRTGSTPEFLLALQELSPKKIIYISCNPETQVRDLKLLLTKYQINYLQGVDLFPHTSHVESIVLMSKVSE